MCPQPVDEEKTETAVDTATSSDNEDESSHARKRAWGKHGKLYMWMGIALLWTVFELDHTTVYNYQNYAMSEFNQISALGALTTAGTMVQAVMKPPIAKISDVVGRAETYCGVVFLFIISYIICATSKDFDQYAGGYMVYCVGATGMQILNQVIVADITSSRWRGLANGLVSLPFMIIPWVSAFISEGVLHNIGWRWGFGILAIILPICSIAVIAPLFVLQTRTIRAGDTVRSHTSITGFFSKLDFGGLILLSGGFAMILIPVALAGNVGWRTPWVPTLIIMGGISLVLLTVYESRIATHPVLPPRFFWNTSLVLAWSMGLLDAFAFNVTHTYMYAWATVVHDLSPSTATFLTYTSGTLQVLMGLLIGYLMFVTHRYKFLLLIGVTIRLIGYGIMLRLRGASNSLFELFLIQIIQGCGSGVVGTVVIVVAQIVVTRDELAQSTALELLFIYLGQALGSAAAGAIYTNLFKPRLRIYLGDMVAQSVVDGIYDSITGDTTNEGSAERFAVNSAYSDVLRYMAIAAIAASVVPMIMVWFVPNLRLSERHNLVGRESAGEEQGEGLREREGNGKGWRERIKRRLKW